MAFEYPALMPQMLAKRATQQGNGTVLQHVDGSTLKFGEAYADALRWADALERLGARRGHPVVTIFSNSFDGYRSWLGCAWLGAIEAPVNTNYKGEWLRHVVNNTEAEVVLTEARFSQPLFDIADQLPHVKHCVVFGSLDSAPPPLPFSVLSEAEFLEGAAVRERAEPEPWEISSLIYTSGTTGRSKAVMVPWRQLTSSLESGMIPRDRLPGISLYSPYPVFHITGKAGFYYATVFGNPSVIREAFSPSEFWADIKRHRPNGLVLLGPLAQMILDQPARADDADNPIRTLVMAPVIPDVDAFCARFDLEVFTTYNMTEINCPIISAEGPSTGANYRSCGKPRQGVEVRIVDEHDIEVPANTPGEMIVRSEPWELNAGYWNMPDKTAEAWRNGWFHTGDAFTFDEDGNYYFVDRAKDYIRRRARTSPASRSSPSSTSIRRSPSRAPPRSRRSRARTRSRLRSCCSPKRHSTRWNSSTSWCPGCRASPFRATSKSGMRCPRPRRRRAYRRRRSGKPACRRTPGTASRRASNCPAEPVRAPQGAGRSTAMRVSGFRSWLGSTR